MQQPPAPVRVVPAGAIVHFALNQRQYAAVLAAIKYFAQKLTNPREREEAQGAYAALSVITHFSLPSEDSSAEAVAARVAPQQEVLPRQNEGRAAEENHQDDN